MTAPTGKISNSDRGGALIIVLAVMLLLTVAAMTAVDIANTDIELSYNKLHSDQAFYVADAGLKRALVKLIENNQWDSGFVSVGFQQGIFSVAVSHTDIDSLIIDTVTLRSTATVERSSANLEAIVVPKLWYPFRYAVFGDDSLIMTNSCGTNSFNSDSGTYAGTVDTLKGDVASNGIVSLTNSAYVGGDASSALEGGLSVCATCSVAGDEADGIEPFDIRPIPDSEFVAAETYNAAPDGFTGSYTYNAVTNDLTLATNNILQLAGGVYFFDDIKLGANSQITIAPGASVKIYMTGNLTLLSNTSVNSGGLASNLMVYSRGSIFTMGMSIDMTATFYGPEADIAIGNSCNFYGSIVGKSVYVDNNALLHYDRALGKYAAGTTGEMIMLAWREL